MKDWWKEKDRLIRRKSLPRWSSTHKAAAEPALQEQMRVERGLQSIKASPNATDSGPADITVSKEEGVFGTDKCAANEGTAAPMASMHAADAA